jgi:hypothetical protein
MTRRLTLVGLLFTANVALAGEASFDKQFWTLYGFPLNDVSLGAVQERLGPTQIFEVPEAHHERAICYRTKDQSAVVVFSSGELGGGKQLLGVSLERQSLHEYPCSKPAADLPAVFPMGLHLGMSEHEFLRTAGVPFERMNSTTLRRFADLKRAITTAESDKRYGREEITRYIQERGGMDVSQTFWVTLRDGKVVALGVWKEETF